MPADKRRSATLSDERDRRRSDSAGLAVPVEVDPESTPPPQVAPLAPGRTPTPPDLEDKVASLIASHNELASGVWEARHTRERFDRIDHNLERLADRLDKYADRVVRAETKGDGAWDALKKLDLDLDKIAGLGVHVERMADSMDRLGERFEALSTRIGFVETEQKLAAERFDTHEARDQERHDEVVLALDQLKTQVTELETARQVADSTAKVRKQIARSVRPWWWSSKGVAAVATAIAAAVAAVIAATQGGCA